MNNNFTQYRITNNLRTLRFNAGEMTQEQLAKLVGVTRQTIVAIEKGNYSPSLELAFKIAAAFNQEIGQVFSYTPGINPGQT